MSQSLESLNIIHLRNQAVFNKRYFADNGRVYIGTKDGKLKLEDKAIETSFKPTSTIPETNVQDAIENLSSGSNIGSLLTDTSTIDFTYNSIVPASITANLKNTTVIAGTYGSAILSPQIIIDAQGRITNAVNVAITAPTSIIVNDILTAVPVYPTWVTANSGALPLFVSSTKISFIPSIGLLQTNINSVLDYIQTTAASTPTIPAVTNLKFWNKTTNGIESPYWMGSDGLVIRGNRDLVSTVRNTSGVTLVAGDVVYSTGATGTAPNVAKAKADSITTMPVVGIVMHTILNNSFGRIQRFGRNEFGFDTSAFAVNDIVYASSTIAGGITNTRPVHPNFNQEIGIVAVSGVGNGSIFITINDPQGYELGTNLNTFAIGSGLAGTKTLSFVNTFTGDLQWTPTAARVLTLPDSTGTLATLAGAEALSNKTGLISQWTNDSAYLIASGTISYANNLTGGLGGQIPYQSAVNTTAMLTNGTAGQVLTSAGTTLAPTWTTPTVGTVTSVSGTANRITSTGGTTPVIDIAATYDALWQPISTNLTSLSSLTYASTSFVKMTAAGTFALDTNTYLTSVALTAGQIGFGSAGNTLTSDSTFTWNNTSKNFNITGTISQVLSNSANVWYVAQGNVGYWYTGATSTGLLSHQGFGIDFKTSNKYTMGDVGITNNTHILVNDTTQAITLTHGGLLTTGTIGSGLWNGTVISPVYGGTGVANNVASTLTISGAFATTLTVTGITGVTLPASGTLYGTLSNSITSAQLASSLTDETGTLLAVFSNSPTFTGTPILPTGTIGVTQAAGNNTTALATTAFVTTAVATSTASSWSLLGNAGTVAATNFIGTTDAIDFRIRTNNTDKVTVLSGGNVGIGTAAPNLYGFGVNDKVLTISATAAATSIGALDLSGGTTGRGIINFGTTLIRQAAILSTNTSDLTFNTNTTNTGTTVPEKMRILANGNVGIGTTAPTEKLDVSGNAASWSTIPGIKLTDVNGNVNGRNWGIYNGGSAYGSLEFIVGATQGASPNNATRVMSLTNAGNVGIGTTAPLGTLSIVSSNTTGTTTSSALNLTTNSLTSGYGIYGSTNSITSGRMMYLLSTSTAGAASGFHSMSRVRSEGANTNSAHSSYGFTAEVVNTGTNSVNYGAYIAAQGADINYSLFIPVNYPANTAANYAIRSLSTAQSSFAGNLGIGMTPVNTLDVTGTFGVTSNAVIGGTIKISGGTPGAGKVLTSDAVGLASWTTPTVGTVTAVTGSGNIASSGGATPNITFTGVLPIANGGTNSATKNWVDLTTNQTVGGTKTFSSNMVVNTLTVGTGGPASGAVSTAFGVSALASANSDLYNTAIGYLSLTNEVNGNFNTAVGANALTTSTGTRNTAIGMGAGHDLATGDGCVFIGYSAGYTELGSDKLYISNSNTATPLIHGDFNTTVLTVNGALDITSTTGYLKIPSLTTAQKTALTAANGMIVYDTTLAKFSFYQAGAWVQPF